MSATAADVIETAVPLLAPGVERATGPDGAPRLHGPPLRHGPVRRRLARVFGLAERVVVELDDIGAFVVDRLDGRTLDQLGADLAAHLKLTRREAEGALAMFLRMLVKRRLVRVETES